MTTKEKNILIYTSIGLVVVGLYLNSQKAKASTSLPTTNPNINKDGSKKDTNKDGSKKVAITSHDGVASTVVDKAGDYIENTDSTTLYNSNGDVIGSLNNDYGMFVDSQGNIIAASDGTPVTVDLNSGTYTEPDGTVYNMDGTKNYSFDGWIHNKWSIFGRIFGND